MEKSHIEQRNEYIELKKKMLYKIELYDREIKRLNKTIIQECSHEWIRERESGPYGEQWTFCKHCRVDSRENFIHS